VADETTLLHLNLLRLQWYKHNFSFFYVNCQVCGGTLSGGRSEKARGVGVGVGGLFQVFFHFKEFQKNLLSFP
jgi:hypothetical protein